jgi:hypothetical protein
MALYNLPRRPSAIQREKVDHAILLLHTNMPGWRTALERLQQYATDGWFEAQGPFGDELLEMAATAAAHEDKSRLRASEIVEVFLHAKDLTETRLIACLPHASPRQVTQAVFHPIASRRTHRAVTRHVEDDQVVLLDFLEHLDGAMEDRVLRPFLVARMPETQREDFMIARGRELAGNAWVQIVMESLTSAPTATVHLIMQSTEEKRAGLRPRHWARLCTAEHREARLAAIMAMSGGMPPEGFNADLLNGLPMDLDHALSAGVPLALGKPRTP